MWDNSDIYYTGGLSPIEVAWPGCLAEKKGYQKGKKFTCNNDRQPSTRIVQKNKKRDKDALKK